MGTEILRGDFFRGVLGAAGFGGDLLGGAWRFLFLLGSPEQTVRAGVNNGEYQHGQKRQEKDWAALAPAKVTGLGHGKQRSFARKRSIYIILHLII